jgi:transcriptional regulator with XRE-family HTH domain
MTDKKHQAPLVSQELELKKKIIGEMVLRYRAKGITREAIVIALGMPPSSLLRMEKGTYKLPLNIFLSICLFIQEDPVEIMRVGVG